MSWSIFTTQPQSTSVAMGPRPKSPPRRPPMPEPWADTADTMLSDFQMIQIFDLESLESTNLCHTCPSRFCRLAVVMRGTMLALLARQLDRRTRGEKLWEWLQKIESAKTCSFCKQNNGYKNWSGSFKISQPYAQAWLGGVMALNWIRLSYKGYTVFCLFLFLLSSS